MFIMAYEYFSMFLFSGYTDKILSDFDFLRKKDFNLGTGKILIKEKGDVPVDTVDNLFKEISVAVMKIDVEGLEETVLKGAKSTIQRDTPVIIVESNVKSKEDSDHTKGLDEILDRLKPTKYEVFCCIDCFSCNNRSNHAFYCSRRQR